jgi:hypothetical protein
MMERAPDLEVPCALSVPAARRGVSDPRGCISSATYQSEARWQARSNETTLVNTGAMKAMMPGMTAPGSRRTPERADLKRTAERGKGVRLLSADPPRPAPSRA